jgi:hypothetical protein
LLNPLLQRHKVGLVLAHHTNKPLRGKEKEGWAAGDFAYLGAGSAEWINPARAALAIRSIGSDDVFELRAAKRGKRLRWTDAEGRPTNVQYIAHHGAPGVICWRQATPEEVAEVTGAAPGGATVRPKVRGDIEMVHAVLARPGLGTRGYAEAGQQVLRVGYGTAVRMLKACVLAGWLKEGGDGRFRRYLVTDQGNQEARKCPSVHAWVECSKTLLEHPSNI